MICDGHDPVLSILRQQEKRVNAQEEAKIILTWIKELLDDDYDSILTKIIGVVSDNCASAHVTRSKLIELMNEADPLTTRDAIKCGGILLLDVKILV